MSALIPSLRAALVLVLYAPGGDSDYYGDWTAQTYGFEADIYPSWWAS